MENRSSQHWKILQLLIESMSDVGTEDSDEEEDRVEMGEGNM
jgi:hypothetical protein